MIRIRNLLNGDIRTKWRRDFYDAGYGPFVPFGALGGDPSPVINWDFLQSQSLTSFSRTSNATLFDSTGQLTYAANNLLLNTATLSTQTVTTGLQAGVSVILSFSGTGSVAISGGYTGSLAGTGVSDRVSLKFTTTTNSLTFTVTGSVTSAQLEAVTYQTTPSTYTATTSSQYYGPRYPYAYNGTTWDAQGLLVEAAGTNLIGYSEAFDNAAWSNSGLDTVSANSTIAPSGTATADTIKTTATNTIHDIYNTTGISFTSGVSYTHSVYLKKNTNDFAQLSLGSAAFGSNAWANFDLVNGVLGSVGSSATAAITSVGNGWYRCAITAAATSTASSFYVVDIANSTTMARQATWSAAGTESLYIWGAQLEAGDQATSYIPNLSTGTTTRNADTSLAFSAISLPTGLSFSRASNAMQYDAAGRLTYAPNNLLTYSNDFSNGAWTKWSAVNAVTPTLTGGQADPLGGSNGWRLQCSGVSASGDRSAIYQSTTNNASANIITIWAKSNTGASQTVAFVDYNAISGGAITVTTSWKQFSISATGANSGIIFGSLGYTSGTGGTIDILIYAPTISLVTYETVARPCDQLITTTDPKYGPRYDYDPLTRLPKGLLIEEGRTNIATYSQDFSNAAWSPYGTGASKVGAASSNAPDNTATAYEVALGTGGGTFDSASAIYQNLSCTNGVTYTVSLWVRAKTGSTSVRLGMNVSAVYNSGDVTVTTDWKRISVTGAATATGTGNISIRTNVAGTSANVFVWGAQLEAGSFPTSYIPNPGIASGIRSADLPDSTSATVIGCNTFLVETIGMQAATTATILGLNAGIGLGATTGNTLTTAFGGTQTTTATATWTGTVRSGIAWGASKVSITFNGNAVTTAANATSALTTTSFGHTNNSGTRGAFMNGWMRKVAGYSSALSDASLATKSTVGANF